jgi:hypothetical protein
MNSAVSAIEIKGQRLPNGVLVFPESKPRQEPGKYQSKSL